MRLGEFDVLVGINLLREGLDMPEVSLVAILDADKEGFLRSERSLIQTIGRAARNLNGRAILYGDRITGSMKRAIDETERRRAIQQAFNKEHGITPQGIKKKISDVMDTGGSGRGKKRVAEKKGEYQVQSLADSVEQIEQLEKEMLDLAKNLEFEKAAQIRDQIEKIREKSIA